MAGGGGSRPETSRDPRRQTEGQTQNLVSRVIGGDHGRVVLQVHNLGGDLRLRQVQSAQLKLDVSARVRFAVGPGAVLAVGRLLGLQVGPDLLAAAQGRPPPL